MISTHHLLRPSLWSLLSLLPSPCHLEIPVATISTKYVIPFDEVPVRNISVEQQAQFEWRQSILPLSYMFAYIYAIKEMRHSKLPIKIHKSDHKYREKKLAQPSLCYFRGIRLYFGQYIRENTYQLGRNYEKIR